MSNVPSRLARNALLKAGLCAAWLLATSLTQGQTPAASPVPMTTGNTGTGTPVELRELREWLPQHRLSGKSRLTVWGFEVYDATLWVAPGFKADKLTAQPFALELAYLRDFTNTDIAKRSIAEMRRSATISDAQAGAWTADIMRVIPNVKKGDRILGVYRPGAGATFLVNGKPVGEILDLELAHLFFGIWLSPTTSEPKLRSALLAGAV